MADYFAIIEKIANDDIFVLKHLLSASIDRLRRAPDTNGTIDSHHLEDALSSVDAVICLRRKLGTSARFSFGTIAMSAIIERRIHSMSDVERVSGTPFSDFEHFIGGYETAWTYSPFMPHRMTGGVYCIPIETLSASPAADPKFFELPFSLLLRAFAEVACQAAKI